MVSKIGACTMAALVSAVFLAAGLGGSAQAREYPWCARYDWTTRNCGFVSFQQCLATISGIGGRCEPNPFYKAPPPRKRGTR
jgi:hypothetical protein